MNPLRPYQIKCVEAVFREWETHTSTMVVIFTGGGKTRVLAELVKRMHPKRSLVIAHRTELIHQAAKHVRDCGLEVQIEKADLKAREDFFHRAPVIVASVQTLVSGGAKKRMEKFAPEDFGLLVVDEFHHAAADSYRAIIDHFKRNPALKIFGCTATPDRADEKALAEVTDSVAFKYDIADGITDGWLVPIEQHLVRVGSLDFSHVRTTAGDLNGADLAAIMEDEKNLQGMTGAAIEIIGDRKSICFTASVRHAEMCAEIFNRHRSGMAVWVSGKTPEDERAVLLKDFYNRQPGQTEKPQVLVNVGVATEGYDCLDQLTEVLTPNGWKNWLSVHNEAEVYGFDRSDGSIKPVRIQSLVTRITGPGEKMFVAESQHINIRTTQGHTFHIADSPRTSKLFSTSVSGADLSVRSRLFRLPLSGLCSFPGLAMSDDEIRFVAWFMTDGGFENTDVVISQSKRFKDEIRSLLIRLGLHFRERVKQGNSGRYANAAPLTCFHIPKGTTSRTGKGWYSLRTLLTKSVSPAMHLLTRDQFRTFWIEALKGDGSVKKGGSGWLWCATKKQADAYTQMAVLRGFSASVAEVTTRFGTIVYRVSCRDTTGISIYPLDERSTRLRMEDHFENETVWCLRNELSTLITRRNGKIVIIGNCPDVECIICGRPTKSRALYTQMVGRGTRTLTGTLNEIHSAYERRQVIAESRKATCLVLDFCGNSGRHKLMTTADILGGKFTDETKALALKKAEKAKGPVNMHKLLEESEEVIRQRIETKRRAEEARKAKLVAKVQYSTKIVNPFDLFDISPQRRETNGSDRALSDKQRTMLQKIGVDPNSVDYHQAQQIIIKQMDRWKKGLATAKQCAVLRKFGYQTDGMTFTEAKQKLDGLAKNKWQRPHLQPA